MNTTSNITVVTKVVEVTAAEVIASERREYNPSAWANAVNRYLTYEDVKLYKAEKYGTHNECFFAVYTIQGGNRWLQEISYSSSLSSSSLAFGMVTADGLIVKFNNKRFANDNRGRAELKMLTDTLGIDTFGTNIF